MQIVKVKFLLVQESILIFFCVREKGETIPQNSCQVSAGLMRNPAERPQGANDNAHLPMRTLENVFILEPTWTLFSRERKVNPVAQRRNDGSDKNVGTSADSNAFSSR